jgi:hypothetical protein
MNTNKKPTTATDTNMVNIFICTRYELFIRVALKNLEEDSLSVIKLLVPKAVRDGLQLDYKATDWKLPEPNPDTARIEVCARMGLTWKQLDGLTRKYHCSPKDYMEGVSLTQRPSLTKYTKIIGQQKALIEGRLQNKKLISDEGLAVIESFPAYPPEMQKGKFKRAAVEIFGIDFPDYSVNHLKVIYRVFVGNYR